MIYCSSLVDDHSWEASVAPLLSVVHKGDSWVLAGLFNLVGLKNEPIKIVLDFPL